jgi:hypothetical protein
MAEITRPCAAVQQLSAAGPNGQWLLSVVAKRTYTVTDGGRCVPEGEQLPLSSDIEESAESPGLVEQDLDLYPVKPLTDVIIKARAYAGRARTSLEATIRIGRVEKRVLVVGDRRCSMSATGRVVFSEPEPFEVMPMSFDRAYGGRDRAAEAKHGNPFEALKPFLGVELNMDNQSPYVYPKNPCGRGYLIEATEEALEMLRLPNLEDPKDLLSPDRLALGEDGLWPYMPMPQGLGWLSHGWFPRMAFAGIPQEFTPSKMPIPEVARGFVPEELLAPGRIEEKFSLRFANGAPVDLQLPFLDPGEIIELTNLHPRRERFTLTLPGDRPRISTDGRNGKLNPTEPVIHTLIIEPDASRVSIVWRGSAPALRPYTEDELDNMPLSVYW